MKTTSRYMIKYEVDDIFLSLIHVALKLRGDILVRPDYKGFNVSVAGAMDCLPDSLYMFLRVLFHHVYVGLGLSGCN